MTRFVDLAGLRLRLIALALLAAVLGTVVVAVAGGWFRVRAIDVQGDCVRFVVGDVGLDEFGIALAQVGVPPRVGEDRFEFVFGPWWSWRPSWEERRRGSRGGRVQSLPSATGASQRGGTIARRNMDGSERDPAGVPGDQPPIGTQAARPGGDVEAVAAPWRRWSLRYLCVHFVLYAAPSPLDWQAVTSWLDDHHLAPYEVIHQPTGSGDTAHDICKLLVIVAVSLLVATGWSFATRGRGDDARLWRWLHLVARFWLAFTLWGYGFGKLYYGQFGELSLTRLTQQIGDTWPMTMVGTFMQASRPYELFGGWGEVLGGALLFHRRTALLGACVTIAVMTNVAALNWLCGVPVKLFSTHLLLCAVLLLLPWRQSLWGLFVRNAPTRPVAIAVPVGRRTGRVLAVAGWAWVLATLFLTHAEGMAEPPWLAQRGKSALYGVWTVERMVLDGTELPATDASRWQFFAVDRGKLAWAREASGRQVFFDFDLAADAASAVVRPRAVGGGAAASAAAPATGPEAAPWTCGVGRKVVPGDPPLLLRAADRGKPVDVERRTLVLTGQLDGRALELHTVEKVFRLQTGFRLRQELPDFW